MVGNIRRHLFVAALAFVASSVGTRADAQVYIGGPGYVGAGYLGGVGFNPGYGFSTGYGNPWYGYGSSYYSTTYFGSPLASQSFVGYAPGGYGFGFSPYGYFRGPYGRGFALPPVVIPAETIYGPGAVQSFIGAGQTTVTTTPVTYNAPVVNVGPIQGGAGQGGGAPGGGFGVNAPGGVQVPRVKHPPSNDAARERSKRQLTIGDDWFRKQNWGNAASAYREAIRAAPDVADAYFHQAAVAVAQARYDAAVESVKSGLKISTTFIDGAFKYSTLYGPNRMARVAHLEAIAEAATAQPSSDLYFLMGVMLFFDEQPRRAGPFFTKSRELAAGGETWHIDVFSEILRRMDAAAAEDAMVRPRVFGPANAAPVNQAPPAANPPRAAVPGRNEREI